MSKNKSSSIVILSCKGKLIDSMQNHLCYAAEFKKRSVQISFARNEHFVYSLLSTSFVDASSKSTETSHNSVTKMMVNQQRVFSLIVRLGKEAV